MCEIFRSPYSSQAGRWWDFQGLCGLQKDKGLDIPLTNCVDRFIENHSTDVIKHQRNPGSGRCGKRADMHDSVFRSVTCS